MPESSRIGRYEIQSELGRGGMGVVYRAHDPKLERAVALKVVNISSSADEESFAKLRERFVLEARVAASLSHPNIIVVYDFGFERTTRELYITMELLEGETLAQRVRQTGAMPESTVLGITRQIASGIAHAHAQGVIHRDLKPSNIMLLEGDRVKILDFGIAKVAEYHVTRSGEFLGSPAFCSPEQISGQEIDLRSDLFSMGSLMFYMLSETKPYKSEKLSDLVFEMIYGDPEPLGKVAPGVSEDVLSLVSRLMAKDPQNRYANAGELIPEMSSILERLAERVPYADEFEEPLASQKTAKIEGLLGSAPKLVFLSGPFEGREIRLEKKSILIGRRDCDIDVPDREISGRHCLLEVGETEYTLRDLKSKNGTFVEGKRILDSNLMPGATFKIGQTSIRLVLEPMLAQAPHGAEGFKEAPVERRPVEVAAMPSTTSVPMDEAREELKEASTLIDVEAVNIMKEKKKSSPILSMTYKLTFLDGPKMGEVFELKEPRVVIGRQDCQVNIKDTRVSRKHAEIEIRGLNTVYLRDLASRNGTYLNDGGISQVQLKNGDVIRVGNTRIRFNLHPRAR